MVGLIFPHLHQQHDHIFQDHPINTNTNIPPSLGMGVGVIPLLSNTQDSKSRETTTHQWQNPISSFLKKPAPVGVGNTTCGDCGNQAKKDCSHGRCRTCCKSRGFSCSTHVKSTWVPAARRRDHQIAGGGDGDGDGDGDGGDGLSGVLISGAKKARVVSLQTSGGATYSHASNSNTTATTTPRSFDTCSSQQDASFRDSLPGHVQAPAVFKCVRVTAMDNGEDEYVYQAMVKIRGHVFKGFLYDQGIERRVGLPDISDLHLGGPGARNGASSSPLVDHLDIYAAASGNGSAGATAYGTL